MAVYSCSCFYRIIPHTPHTFSTRGEVETPNGGAAMEICGRHISISKTSILVVCVSPGLDKLGFRQLQTIHSFQGELSWYLDYSIRYYSSFFSIISGVEAFSCLSGISLRRADNTIWFDYTVDKETFRFQVFRSSNPIHAPRRKAHFFRRE